MRVQENDRAFGTIAQTAKRRQVIASPTQWLKVAQRSRGGFNAIFMQQPRFRDWATYMRRLYTVPATWRTTDGAKVHFLKIRWFNLGVGEDQHGVLHAHADQVWFRYGLDPDAEPWSKIALERRGGVVANIDDAEFTLYTEPRTLPPKKVRDLAKMKAFLKPEFHALYPDPPASDDGDDDGASSLSEASTQHSSADEPDADSDVDMLAAD